MSETQASCFEWAEQTFGPAADVIRLIGRANTEMAELVCAATSGEVMARIGKEAADVAIVLCRAAALTEVFVPFGIPAPPRLRLRGALANVVAANKAVADLLVEFGSTRRPYWRTTVGALFQRAFLYLCAVCESAGTTLQAEVDRKMAINRKRRWVVAGDGDGDHAAHHVRIEEAT